MKDVFIARQPILNRQCKLFAYELLFRADKVGGFPGIDGGVATSSVLSTSFFVTGIDKLANGYLAFVNFPSELLNQDIAQLFPHDEIAIEVLEDVPPTSILTAQCKKLSDAGYQIVLDDFEYRPIYDELLEVADIVKVDFRALNEDEIRATVQAIRPFNVRLLAEKIETHEEFELAKSMGFTLFQGYFFAKPEVMQRRIISSNEQSMLRLINVLYNIDYDIDAIEEIIKIDVALSHKLLNFLNSAYFSRLHPVSSIRQAIVFLGEKGVRQFVTLIVMSHLTEKKPKELSRISVIRAYFLQNISMRIGGMKHDELFMMGLFSLVPAMLDCSMADALAHLPISDEIKLALVDRDGELHPFLQLVESYEHLDQADVNSFSQLYGLESNSILESYMDAVEMADKFISEI